MVLDRNPDNFFAETEQVAFHPGHVVPGIDFTNDPLLQGRLFSYTDTQLLRLGGANFHEIPVNRPKCPMRNFQRDGVRRMDVNPGQVAYEPNSLAPDSPREDPAPRFCVAPGARPRRQAQGSLRDASPITTASRGCSSARCPSPNNVTSSGAFTFELSKVSTAAIRRRMLGHLAIIDAGLCQRVAEGLGMEGQAEQIAPARPPIDMKPSPALSLVKKAVPTLEGRKVGVLVTDGTDGAFVDALKTAVEKAGARLQVVAPKIGGVTLAGGKSLAADHQLAGGPSILFDAVVVAASEQGAATAAEGSRGHRLDARCVRPPQGHWRHRRRRGAARQGRDRSRRGSRDDRKSQGPGVYRCGKRRPDLGSGAQAEGARLVRRQLLALPITSSEDNGGRDDCADDPCGGTVSIGHR